jgi:hypothetical protein
MAAPPEGQELGGDDKAHRGQKTTVPMASIYGSAWPCRISRIIIGTVRFRPETNQATMNSSKLTAAVRHRAETILTGS